MKNTSFLALFLLGWFFVPAQITNRQNELPQPIITILKTEPEQPVEGGRIIVYFRFTNRIGNTLNGWIGAELFSGTSAPGRSPVDWPVINLEKDQTIDGAVIVNTTDAGINKKLQVYFYQNQEIRADNSIRKSAPLYTIGEKDINVAALVNFKLNTFTIHHTRARTTDTDYGSLYAVVNDVPVMAPASIFLGNFDGGSYLPFKGKDADDKLLDDVETGPIALVPGQNSSLYIAYTIYNGGGVVERKSFLRGYAEATANPIMFHGPRPGTSAAFEAMKVLNPFLNTVGACDGFVVMDTITINTNGIFTNTMRGDKDFSKRYNTEDYASQTGCGNTSDYEVGSSIRRMSYSRPASNDDVAVYTKITANRTVSLNEKSESEVRMFYDINRQWAEKNSMQMGLAQVASHGALYDINWAGTETIDRQGNIIQVNDREHGYVSRGKYYAPPLVSRPLLVILRGSVIDRREDMKTQSLSVLNNGPLRQVTAIVQLIPGMLEMVAKTNYTPPPPPPQNTTEKTGEDYGKRDTATALQKVVTNYRRPVSVAGEWRYKITSSGGAVFTGVLNLQQNGSSVSGTLNVNDNTRASVSGTLSGEVLNLSRDTGLETIQHYTLNKVNDTYFSGTYKNVGKYADSGTVEFFR